MYRYFFIATYLLSTCVQDLKCIENEIIGQFKYPTEAHNVVTEDGYILTLFRVLSKDGETNNATKSGRVPVLLMHGLLVNSDIYVVMGPKKSLAFFLAENGYDVWLGNIRGNGYSRNHTQLDPNIDKQFWMFSLNEMGSYDLPAMIDYILKTTGQKSLHYVGHSQGAAVFFMFAAEKPEYNRKIRSMMAMAPAVFLNHMKQPLVQYLAKYNVKFLMNIFDMLGVYEMFPPMNVVWSKVVQEICSLNMFKKLCLEITDFVVGDDNCGLVKEPELTLVLQSFPDSVSVRQLAHFLQFVQTGEFKKFDHGDNNMKVYKRSEPPKYDLSKVNVPVAVFYSSNDMLVSTVDAFRLIKELPNVKLVHRIDYEKFTHLEYMVASRVMELVNTRVLKFLKRRDKYNRSNKL